MNVKEFKIHLMRGLLRPEYFYIPIIRKSTEPTGIFVEVLDQNGDPVYVSGIEIYYNVYSLYHDVHKEGDTWITKRDSTYKGYAFQSDYDWRYPPEVPDPSDYEIYPFPDFTSAPPQIDGSSITTVWYNYALFAFDEPKSLIEVKNLSAGSYSMNVKDVVIPSGYRYNGISYYPDYYNDYDNTDGTRPVSHSNGNCQVDKNGRFSGFAKYDLSDPSDRHPTGYNFYCVSRKFQNNTMPVVADMTKIHSIRIVYSWISVPGYVNIDWNVYEGYDYQYYLPDNPETIIRSHVPISEHVKVDSVLGFRFYVDDEYVGTITDRFDVTFSRELHYENEIQIFGSMGYTKKSEFWRDFSECIYPPNAVEVAKNSAAPVTLYAITVNGHWTNLSGLVILQDGDKLWINTHYQSTAYRFDNDNTKMYFKAKNIYAGYLCERDNEKGYYIPTDEYIDRLPEDSYDIWRESNFDNLVKTRKPINASFLGTSRHYCIWEGTARLEYITEDDIQVGSEYTQSYYYLKDMNIQQYTELYNKLGNSDYNVTYEMGDDDIY